MSKTKSRGGIAVAAFFLASSSAFAQFSGYFVGYYAPANWNTYMYNNTAYQGSADVDTSYAPGSLVMNGAFSTKSKAKKPQLPVSIVDYNIVLQGTGLEPILFNYLFTGAADGYDAAEFIYYNATGAQVVQSLSTVIGVEQTFSAQAMAGQTIDFRLISNNDHAPDQLTICQSVPEPSTLALLGLGTAALLWRARQRLS